MDSSTPGGSRLTAAVASNVSGFFTAPAVQRSIRPVRLDPPTVAENLTLALRRDTMPESTALPLPGETAMQRRMDLFLGIMAVLAACSAEQGTGAQDAADPLYLGRPVSYWVDRAGKAAGDEERAQVVDALVAALNDKEPAVRVAAGDALGSCGEENLRAIDALVGVLSDPSAWVRTAAMETLGKIGGPAVPALLGTFENAPPVVGVRAGIILRDIGEAARAELEKGEPWRFGEDTGRGRAGDRADCRRCGGGHRPARDGRCRRPGRACRLRHA